MEYIVCEIGGRQYRVGKGKIVEINNFSSKDSSLTVDKILLSVKDGQVEIGKPYLKKQVDFKIVGRKSKKIRVFTYKAKANFRKAKGAKRQIVQISF